MYLSVFFPSPRPSPQRGEGENRAVLSPRRWGEKTEPSSLPAGGGRKPSRPLFPQVAGENRAVPSLRRWREKTGRFPLPTSGGRKPGGSLSPQVEGENRAAPSPHRWRESAERFPLQTGGGRVPDCSLSPMGRVRVFPFSRGGGGLGGGVRFYVFSYAALRNLRVSRFSISTMKNIALAIPRVTPQ